MCHDLTPSLRVARVTLRLVRGEHMTTAQVAELCGMRRESAYRLLERISTELTLVLDDGEWYYLDALPPR